MDSKTLLKKLTYLIFFIFIFNFLAIYFYWYSSIWWFDMPMHFLGGFWLGLAVIWLLLFKDVSGGISVKLILKVFLGVLCVGVSWELYEILVNNVMAHNPFNTLDTISDACFDLAGGLSALFYVSKKIILIPENTVQYSNGKNI